MMLMTILQRGHFDMIKIHSSRNTQGLNVHVIHVYTSPEPTLWRLREIERQGERGEHSWTHWRRMVDLQHGTKVRRLPTDLYVHKVNQGGHSKVIYHSYLICSRATHFTGARLRHTIESIQGIYISVLITSSQSGTGASMGICELLKSSSLHRSFTQTLLNLGAG